MKHKFSVSLSLALIVVMLVSSVALADSLIGDALATAPGTADNTSQIVAGGDTIVYEFGALISNTGGDKDNVFPGTVNVDITRAGDWLSTLSGTPSTLSFDTYDVTKTGTISISVPCNSQDTLKVMTVLLSADPSTNGKTLDANKDAVTLTYNILAGANGVNCPLPPSNTAPLLTLPADFTVEGNTTGGAIATYTSSASDAEDGPLTPSCAPASGSFFALGETTVSCSVTDSGGLSASGSFKITVVDTTAPTLVGMPADMTVEGNTTGGANVTFTDPTATDVVDASPSVACIPASGSLFGLGGPHTVTCTATDYSNNAASDTFDVTVVDTTAPTISCPANITGIVGQVVNLGLPTVSDIVDANPTVVNDVPPSFGPGTTTVTWTATDASLNSAACSQTVTLTYIWNGFFQPVDNLPTVNKAKAGQAIPFKWSLQDANGNFVSDLSAVASYGYGSLSCGAGTTDVIESYDTTGTSGLRYDPIANQFIFTSKTDKAWAGSCKTFTLYLNDGTKHQANFNFVK